MKYTSPGPVDFIMATKITSVSMATDHMMQKTPDINRRHRSHRNAYANHRKSAVELLEASKSEYVKSSRVLNHRQELKHPENLCVGNRDGISSPSHSILEDKIKTESGKKIDSQAATVPNSDEHGSLSHSDDTWTTIVSKISDTKTGTAQVELEVKSASKFKRPITPPKLSPKPTVPAKPKTPPKSTLKSVPSPVTTDTKPSTPQKLSVPSQPSQQNVTKPLTPPKPAQLTVTTPQTSSAKSFPSAAKASTPLKTSPDKPIPPPKPERRSNTKSINVGGDVEPPPVPERRSSANIFSELNRSSQRRDQESRTIYGHCDESKSNRSDIQLNSISGGTDNIDAGENITMSTVDEKGAVKNQDQIVKRFSSLSASSSVIASNDLYNRDSRLPGNRKASGSSTRSREAKESHSSLSSPSDALLKPMYSNKLSISVGVLAEKHRSPLPRPKSDKLPDDFGMPKRRQLHRSQSDLSSCRHSRTGSDFSDMSSRVSRTSTEVERFFNEMGLDRMVIEPMLRLQDIRPKGILESLSSFGSEDAHSVRSRVSQTDMEKVPVESEPDLMDRSAEGTSIVERNARIIKWLCNVKKSHNVGPKKPVATS